jgi:Flp pilus assembly protein TadG
MTRHLFKLCRDEAGNSFIELGLALPLMTAMLLGAVDISRAVSAKLAVEQAAQRTIEKLQVTDFNFDATHDDRTTYQSEAATAAGVATTAVAVNAWLQCNTTVQTPMDQSHFNGTCADGTVTSRYVSVQISKNITPMFRTRFFPGANADGTVTLGSKAVVRVQ